jgi:hypothetical protein
MTLDVALARARATVAHVEGWELPPDRWALIAQRLPDLVAALDAGDARAVVHATSAVEAAGPLRGVPEVTSADPAPQVQPVPDLVAPLIELAGRAVAAARDRTRE